MKNPVESKIEVTYALRGKTFGMITNETPSIEKTLLYAFQNGLNPIGHDLVKITRTKTIRTQERRVVDFNTASATAFAIVVIMKHFTDSNEILGFDGNDFEDLSKAKIYYRYNDAVKEFTERRFTIARIVGIEITDIPQAEEIEEDIEVIR